MVDTSGLTLVTQAQFARLVGKSRQSVSKAVISGRLPTHGPRKLIDAASAMQQLAGSVSRVNVIDEDDADDLQPPAASGPSLTQLKARTEEERATLLRLDRLEREGMLVPRDQVALEQETAARLVKKALDTIPSHAEDLEAAATRGSLAFRKALKDLVRSVQESIANSMVEAAAQLEIQRLAEVDDDVDDATT